MNRLNGYNPRMRLHSNLQAVRWVVWVAGLLVVALGLAPAATTSPATASVDRTLVVQLEDPLHERSKCFLDLDTADTFPFSRYHDPAFVREQGVDLMCETRTPADGFVLYDLALIESALPFEQAPHYDTLRTDLAAAELKRFEMMAIKSELPKRYLFRTREGAMGVLEFSGLREAPPGLKLRYRIVTPPERKLPPPRFKPLRRPPEVRIADAELELKRLNLRLGENHPTYQRQMAKVKALKQVVAPAPVDRPTQQLQDMEVWLKTLRVSYGENHPLIKGAEAQLAHLKRRAADAQSVRAATGRGPATTQGVR